MCGIWVGINASDADVKKADNIKHRGPSASLLTVDRNVSIVFHRLSIMDVSDKGMQPFKVTLDDKTYYLVCNGEIYNYKSLRDKYDLKCQSNSDCEVILQLFLGLKCDFVGMLQELIGEFALTLVCISPNNVTCYMARDQAGVRPLFYSIVGTKFICASEMKAISTDAIINYVDPRYIYRIDAELNHFVESNNMLDYLLCDATEYDIKLTTTKWYTHQYATRTKTYDHVLKQIIDLTYDIAQKEVVDTLVQCTVDRFQSDVPYGCLLSGGLDSSLVAAITANLMPKEKELHCFSIGSYDSPDIIASKIMFAHLNKIKSNMVHHVINFDHDIALNNIDAVIRLAETFDITTIRASAGQFMLAQYISTNTDIKVLLNGDGADEIEMGYMYFHRAPSINEAQQESERLLREIHKYDVLRVDRAISGHGLEARVPFLDVRFIDMYMSLDPAWKIPTNGIEKYFIRSAFEKYMPNLLPTEILWRKKEAFSDGVSNVTNSWYKKCLDHFHNMHEAAKIEIENAINKTESVNAINKINPVNAIDISAESQYYINTFEKWYPNQHHNIGQYWLPKWTNAKDPSARTW
jgi:asparagine synthase (glutamine-hydrolysing)